LVWRVVWRVNGARSAGEQRWCRRNSPRPCGRTWTGGTRRHRFDRSTVRVGRPEGQTGSLWTTACSAGHRLVTCRTSPRFPTAGFPASPLLGHAARCTRVEFPSTEGLTWSAGTSAAVLGARDVKVSERMHNLWTNVWIGGHRLRRPGPGDRIPPRVPTGPTRLDAPPGWPGTANDVAGPEPQPGWEWGDPRG
jgi:hypothetical protein